MATQTQSGRWYFNDNISPEKIAELVTQLNEFLGDSQLLQVTYDTENNRALDPGFGQLHAAVCIQTKFGRQYLAIPMGGWTLVPTKPVKFKGSTHTGFVQIYDDHVVIKYPYTYGDQLEWMHISITRLRISGR